MFRKIKKSSVLISLLLFGSIALSGCGSDNSSSQSSESSSATSSSTTTTDSSSASTTSSSNSENLEKTNTVDSSDKIVLTLWHYYNGATKDMLDNMITDFNETVGVEKNIVIDAYSHSNVNDLATTLVSSANKEVGVETMPDIFSAYSDTALLLDKLGVIANMDLYLTDEELSLFRSDFLEEGKFDDEGNLKILPVAKSTEVLFINDTDFQIFSDATGVELSQLSTWESMAEVAEIYYNWTDAQTEEENDGRALFGIDSEANFMLIASKQLGEEIYDYSDNSIKFGLSEEGAKKIWDYYLTPYIKGYYTSFGSFRSDDVKSGDLLMYAGSTSSVYYFPSSVELGRTESYDIDGTTMPYPYFEDGEQIVVQQGAGMLISKSDEAREAASMEFLKWFTAPENNLEFAVLTGYMPVQNEALSYDSVMSVMEENTDGDISKIVLSSANTSYNLMLPEYEYYANKPFVGSYDTRNILRNHVVDTLQNATNELEEKLSQGADRDEVISELISEENFKKWYLEFETSINDVLIEY